MLDLIHHWGAQIHRKSVRSKSLPRPVISVGNLAFGGRAKTPFIIYLVEYLKGLDFDPVVLTRGYGRRNKKFSGQVLSHDVDLFGDEALEIYCKSSVPVLVGANRLLNAVDFCKKKAGLSKVVFLLDDGFQHWPIKRDLDIVIITDHDLRTPFYSIGCLRERPSALSRADIILKLASDLKKTTVLSVKPSSAKALLLCTRASDSQSYLEDLRMIFSQAILWELPDHASLPSLSAIHNKFSKLFGSGLEPHIVLGLKEAVKLVKGEELRDFLKVGQHSIQIDEVRSIRFIFADCKIELSSFSENLLKNKIREVLL